MAPNRSALVSNREHVYDLSGLFEWYNNQFSIYFIQQFNKLHFITSLQQDCLTMDCVFAENIREVKGGDMEALLWTLNKPDMDCRETHKHIRNVNRLNILTQFNSSKYLPTTYCITICSLINFSGY